MRRHVEYQKVDLSRVTPRMSRLDLDEVCYLMKKFWIEITLRSKYFCQIEFLFCLFLVIGMAIAPSRIPGMIEIDVLSAMKIVIAPSPEVLNDDSVSLAGIRRKY